MRVILFRHGPAGHRDESRWPDDSLRPLSPKGVKRTRAAASGLARLERDIAIIATSPLLRASETAELLREMAPSASFETLETLVPGGSSRKTIEWCAGHEQDGAIVLVGHEPDLGRLAGVMLLGTAWPMTLRKAGACGIEFEEGVKAGAGQLEWFLPPRVLRSLARKKARA